MLYFQLLLFNFCKITLSYDCTVFQVGLLDMEINQLTKVLFVAVIALSVLMMALKVDVWNVFDPYFEFNF